MPATAAAQQRAAQRKKARMDSLTLAITEQTGMIPRREEFKTYHGAPTYKVVWHLAWWDGQMACGKTWGDGSDLTKAPRSFLTKNVCGRCIQVVRTDDGKSVEEMDAWLTEMMSLAQKITWDHH